MDAIHPGYGFLSENADLSQACVDAGITFVGPTPELLRTFGDKTAAKKLAKQSDVPTVPGTEMALTDPAEIKAAAKEIGYPLIIKASFGGGGRGMRVVRHGRGADAASWRRPSAKPARRLGGPKYLSRRYIPRPSTSRCRSWATSHGNLVHLWERDCSVQRRHQKVVEIAPSVNLPRKCGSKSAKRPCDCASGEISQRRNRGISCWTWTRDEFFFIEVNPRIQVEHTVTEVVTGLIWLRARFWSRRAQAARSAD